MNDKHKIRVLIIDDHAILRMGLTSLLETTGDIDVVGDASNGEAGLRKAVRLKPDVILLDLMMPGIDGFEVIRRLLANPETADIQIVILSALTSNEDIIKGFDVGANDFIMKPIIMEKLLTCVVTHLQLAEAKKTQA